MGWDERDGKFDTILFYLLPVLCGTVLPGLYMAARMLRLCIYTCHASARYVATPICGEYVSIKLDAFGRRTISTPR